MRSRRELAKVAEVCVLPNEERVKNFKAKTGTHRPVECVWNVPRHEEVRQVKQEPNASDSLKIFYGGSLSTDRLPLNVLDAIVERYPRISLQIVGYATYLHHDLAKKIQDYQKKGVIQYYGPMSRYNIWEIADKCEAALCLMPRGAHDINLKDMVGASNKPFDAMARGLAVVISDLPEWTRMYLSEGANMASVSNVGEKGAISAMGYGIAINPESRESITAGLDWMLENRQKLWEMGERGRLKIQHEWNYEAMLNQVLAHIHI